MAADWRRRQPFREPCYAILGINEHILNFYIKLGIYFILSQYTITSGLDSVSMICLRCGGCCHNLDIFVVNPDRIREDGSIDPHDPDSMIMKPSGKKCPHLFFQAGPDGSSAGTAVCSIHHLPCYQGSPCQQFEQMGREDDVCMMSDYFRKLDDRKRSRRALF